MLLDTLERVLEHVADFARLEMPETLEDEIVFLLVPGAVQKDGVDVRIEPQVG